MEGKSQAEGIFNASGNPRVTRRKLELMFRIEIHVPEITPSEVVQISKKFEQLSDQSKELYLSADDGYAYDDETNDSWPINTRFRDWIESQLEWIRIERSYIR